MELLSWDEGAESLREMPHLGVAVLQRMRATPDNSTLNVNLRFFFDGEIPAAINNRSFLQGAGKIQG